MMASLSLACVMETTASATADWLMPMMASTPPWSNHCRAISAPTSGLFSMSPTMTSTAMSGWAAPNSRTAMRTAAALPRPPAAE